jgi:hypothetical protein
LTKTVTKQQKEAIRSYVKNGYSANQIQIKLKNQHLGLRRIVLLAEVRKVKGQKLKAGTAKYIPKKYAQAPRVKAPPRKRLRPFFAQIQEKQVTIIGRHYGKRIIKKHYGKGRDLYRFVKDEMTGDYWDEKPQVFS